MSRKTNAMMYAFMAMAGMSSYNYFGGNKTLIPEPNFEKVVGKLKIKNQEIKKSRLNKFEIEGKEIYALNYKNALRKYNKSII